MLTTEQIENATSDSLVNTIDALLQELVARAKACRSEDVSHLASVSCLANSAHIQALTEVIVTDCGERAAV